MVRHIARVSRYFMDTRVKLRTTQQIPPRIVEGDSLNIGNSMYRALRKLTLGRTDLPQACDIELDHPQNEIVVRLLGIGAPRDVTHFHSVACAKPFSFCIGLESAAMAQLAPGKQFVLEFCECRVEGKVLGRIKLKFNQRVPVLDDYGLALFEAIECHNFCLPRYRLKVHEFFNTYKAWKNRRPGEPKYSTLDSRCNAVTFICPRPIVLVCVVDGPRGNVFPMNLLGNLGNGYFAFALDSRKQASSLVRRLGRLTVSTVPLSQKKLVRQLGRNHYLDTIRWDELPLQLRQATDFTIPFPEFAIRTKELHVLETMSLGSHDLFIAKVGQASVELPGKEFHMIHGFYLAYRSQADLLENQD